MNDAEQTSDERDGEEVSQGGDSQQPLESYDRFKSLVEMDVFDRVFSRLDTHFRRKFNFGLLLTVIGLLIGLIVGIGVPIFLYSLALKQIPEEVAVSASIAREFAGRARDESLSAMMRMEEIERRESVARAELKQLTELLETRTNELNAFEQSVRDQVAALQSDVNEARSRSRTSIEAMTAQIEAVAESAGVSNAALDRLAGDLRAEDTETATRAATALGLLEGKAARAAEALTDMLLTARHSDAAGQDFDKAFAYYILDETASIALQRVLGLDQARPILLSALAATEDEIVIEAVADVYTGSYELDSSFTQTMESLTPETLEQVLVSIEINEPAFATAEDAYALAIRCIQVSGESDSLFNQFIDTFTETEQMTQSLLGMRELVQKLALERTNRLGDRQRGLLRELGLAAPVRDS